MGRSRRSTATRTSHRYGILASARSSEAGLAAGPVGVVIGGAVGVLGGTLDDAIRAGASDEYIERIGEHMTPGTYALIADVHETENDPINS